jgi:hypothetical protein
MTTTTDIDPAHDAPDPSLDAEAAASLSALFEARPSIAADLEETGRAQAHLQQQRQRELDAVEAQGKAEQRAASLTAKLDLADQRFAGFTVGVVVVAALLVFDAIPLNWAAQAFGLDAAATWLVTTIMLAASAGAMAGIELTRDDARRRQILLVMIGVGYLALTVLRGRGLLPGSAAPGRREDAAALDRAPAHAAGVVDHL